MDTKSIEAFSEVKMARRLSTEKNDAEDWNLLCHLDPTILEIQDTEEYVKETMDNPNN